MGWLQVLLCPMGFRVLVRESEIMTAFVAEKDKRETNIKRLATGTDSILSFFLPSFFYIHQFFLFVKLI